MTWLTVSPDAEDRPALLEWIEGFGAEVIGRTGEAA